MPTINHWKMKIIKNGIGNKITLRGMSMSTCNKKGARLLIPKIMRHFKR